MSAAAIIRKQNRLMRKFVEHHATSSATAEKLEDLDCRQGWIFRRMVARGVFVLVGDDRFYMDENASREFIRRRKIKIAVFTGIFAISFLFWLAWHYLD
jgi:hypothetical protein